MFTRFWLRRLQAALARPLTGWPRHTLRPRARLVLECLEGRIAPSTFVVTTGLDNGNDSSPTPGSLRAAIVATNQSPGTAANPNLISFDIPTTDPSYNS